MNQKCHSGGQLLIVFGLTVFSASFAAADTLICIWLSTNAVAEIGSSGAVINTITGISNPRGLAVNSVYADGYGAGGGNIYTFSSSGTPSVFAHLPTAPAWNLVLGSGDLFAIR